MDPQLEIMPASLAEKPIVARMVQLYLHDFSELAAIGSPYGDVDESGAFALTYFDSYWQEADRMALLLRVGGQLAGFALINKWSPTGLGTDRSIAEYFVMRKYRRAGVGRCAAHEIVRRYPGIWEVNVAHYNAPAQEFWQRAVSAVPGYAVEKIEGDGKRWQGPIYRLTPVMRPRV